MAILDTAQLFSANEGNSNYHTNNNEDDKYLTVHNCNHNNEIILVRDINALVVLR